MIRFLTLQQTLRRDVICRRASNRAERRVGKRRGFGLLLAIGSLSTLGCESVNHQYGGVRAPYLNASYAHNSGLAEANYGSIYSTTQYGKLLSPSTSATEWTHFGDGQLLELLSVAMAENPSIEEMAWRIDEAKRTLQTLNAQRHSVWEKDLHGRLVQATRAATADRQAVTENLNDVRRRLAGDIASWYITLRLNQEMLRQTQINLQVQQATLMVAKERLDAGEVTPLDVAQVESQIKLTQADKPLHQQGIETAFHRIALLLGTTPDPSLSGVLRPAEQLVPAPIAAEAPAVLLRRRPDIRRRERLVASASAQVGVAQAEALKWKASSAEKGQVKISEASLRQAIARYRGSILSAVAEVEDALAAQHRQRERVMILTDTVAQSGNAVKSAMQQYAGDQISIHRLLASERQLLTSSIELAKARAAAAQATVDVFQALGGGDTYVHAPIGCQSGFPIQGGFCE